MHLVAPLPPCNRDSCASMHLKEMIAIELDSYIDKIKNLAGNVPENLQDHLQFEFDMFLSKLNLLINKENQTSYLNRESTRKFLFEFLKSDLVLFLQKLLLKKSEISSFIELNDIHREIKRIFRELGIFNYNPPGKDLEKSTIIERWYSIIRKKETLTTNKILNYFAIYRNRLYSLADNMPYLFSDLNKLIRKMLISEQFEFSFNEIYNAELELRNELVFTLLKEVSLENRLEYLISKDIFIQLSDSFIKTLQEEYANHLKENLARQEKIHTDIIKKKESMDTEIILAKKFYAKTLDHPIPENNDKIRFTTWFAPYIYIGGDFYRIIEIEKNIYAVFVADIAGHGISAALFLNTLHHTFEENKSFLTSPAEFMNHLNEGLYGKTGDYFITGMIAIIDTKQKIIKYANAGHTKGFLYTLKNAQQSIKFLRPTGRVLGIFKDDISYREESYKYKEESRLVLYTDGLTEMYNDKDKFLGERGLLKILEKANYVNTDDTLPIIRHNIENFLGKSTPDDDICLILIDLY